MLRIVYILCLLTTMGFAQTKMSVAEAEQLKVKVKQQAEKTTTITSDFVQYKHLDFLSDDIITKGNLSFKAPNNVKWAYSDPFHYTVIFKEKTMYVNDEGNKSKIDIGSSKLFKQLNKLIVNSVKGDLFDEKEFKITYFKKEANALVHFEPRNEKFKKYIKAFHINFNAKGEVVEVKMIEPTEDYTKIVFSGRITNKPLSDAIFTN